MIRFGRIFKPDARDKSFRMQPPSKPAYSFRNWLLPGPVRDQGNTSQCVAYSAEALLRSLPVVNAHRPDLEINIPALYSDAQMLDPFEGTDYEGTTVRAGMAALKEWGFVERYEWAWDIHTVVNHVLSTGPVVMGTSWTAKMMEPDDDGYIWSFGNDYGGHAYLVSAVNLNRNNPDGTKGALRITNSWGTGWGQNGRAWISIDHAKTLLDYNGEAVKVAEVRYR